MEEGGELFARKNQLESRRTGKVLPTHNFNLLGIRLTEEYAESLRGGGWKIHSKRGLTSRL